MIRYLERNAIEIEKYNACIANSLHAKMYAFSWYLDCLSVSWGVLVLNDYEAVMPIPWKQKYFIKYVVQPNFCQQLGVFSAKELANSQISAFINSVPSKFKKGIIHLNNGNNFINKKVENRVNYVLKIEDSFQLNLKKFNKNRKRTLKKATNSFLHVANIQFDKLLAVAVVEKKEVKSATFTVLTDLVKQVLKMEKGFVLGVYTNENKLVGGAFFLKSTHRITYLFSAMNAEGKRLNGATFLISHVLKENTKQNLVFDFEGSMNIGVSNFFRSFGAEVEMYQQLKYINLFNF